MINLCKASKKILVVTLLTYLLFAVPAWGASNGYLGTDDLIEKKMQVAADIRAKKPFIDISKGNLGLFVFAVGGFAAGVTVGYYWRKIFVEKAGK